MGPDRSGRRLPLEGRIFHALQVRCTHMESDVEETQAALVAQKVCAQSAGHAPRHQINSDGNLYRLAGRLTSQNGGFRPGQWRSPTSRSPRRPQRHAGRRQRRTRQPRGREEGFRRVVTESGIKIFYNTGPDSGEDGHGCPAMFSWHQRHWHCCTHGRLPRVHRRRGLRWRVLQ